MLVFNFVGTFKAWPNFPISHFWTPYSEGNLILFIALIYFYKMSNFANPFDLDLASKWPSHRWSFSHCLIFKCFPIPIYQS